MIEQGPDDEDRPPGGGIDDVEIFGFAVLPGAVAAEEPLELGEDLDQEVLAAEVGDGALLDLAVVAIGFDDADVLVDRAAGGADFDGSEVHAVKYHDRMNRNQATNSANLRETSPMLSLRISETRRPPMKQSWKTRQNRASKPAVRGHSPQTWASEAPANERAGNR